MGNLYIPSEEDFKRWLKETLEACLDSYFEKRDLVPTLQQDEPLRSRKEIAEMFEISLVTLNSWTKKGLPFHKQGGRVYFFRSEVLEYLKSKRQKLSAKPVF